MAAVCERDVDHAGDPIFSSACLKAEKFLVIHHTTPCAPIHFEPPRCATRFIPHPNFHSTLHLPLYSILFFISVSDAIMVDFLEIAFFVWTGWFLLRGWAATNADAV